MFIFNLEVESRIPVNSKLSKGQLKDEINVPMTRSLFWEPVRVYLSYLIHVWFPLGSLCLSFLSYPCLVSFREPVFIFLILSMFGFLLGACVYLSYLIHVWFPLGSLCLSFLSYPCLVYRSIPRRPPQGRATTERSVFFIIIMRYSKVMWSAV